MNLSIERLKARCVRRSKASRGWRSLVALLGGILLLANGPAHAQISEIIEATGDGMGNALDGPRFVATDGSGNVFVAGLESDNVFKITPGGTISEIIDATGDGVGNGLFAPAGVATDGSGNVFVTGNSSDNAFKITTGGAKSETSTRRATAWGTGSTEPPA